GIFPDLSLKDLPPVSVFCKEEENLPALSFFLPILLPVFPEESSPLPFPPEAERYSLLKDLLSERPGFFSVFLHLLLYSSGSCCFPLFLASAVPSFHKTGYCQGISPLSLPLLLSS